VHMDACARSRAAGPVTWMCTFGAQLPVPAHRLCVGQGGHLVPAEHRPIVGVEAALGLPLPRGHGYLTAASKDALVRLSP
jgi:hypothetical protein